MEKRPFRILGVQQVAVGALDRSRLHRLWVNLLGLTVQRRFENEGENTVGEIAALTTGPLPVDLNILEPLDPRRSPRVQEPALNHIGLWIDDLQAAVPWLRDRGVELTPGGIRRGAAGHEMCFIHPRAGGEGVLVELVQAPPEVIAAFDAIAEAARGLAVLG